MNTQAYDKKYITATYSRQPVTFVKGKGSTLTDENGKKYIDFGSGIAVNGLGICNKKWLKAVNKQAKTLAHTSNLYYSEPQVKLAQMLAQKTGFSKFFFSNSGAEANECAIKTAKKYSFDKYGLGRQNIITLKNSFHGRTIATLSATGQDVFHNYFFPFVEGFSYAEPNDFDSVKSLVNEQTCAIMLELVQGEGGVIALDTDFVKKTAELCKEKDILLIIDEVQTGNGRTGTLYAYMQYGISPDIVSTAKGLGGGLPLGVTFFNEKTQDVLTYGTHGTTFGGNPVCCAGAAAILEQIDQELLDGVNEKHDKILYALEKCKKVKSVSGLGLMLGIELDGADAKTVLSECLNKGLVVLSAKNKVRLLPSLAISDKELEKGLNILLEVLQ